MAIAERTTRLLKHFDFPEEIRHFPKGKLEIVEVDGIAVGRYTLEPGWKWSESVKPIAGTASCEVSHLAYMISGRMRIRMDDGTEAEAGPGDVAAVPPGHDAWVVGDEPAILVDFAGAEHYAERRL